MAELIITLTTEEDLDKFCDTETTNFEGEPLGILGRMERYANGLPAEIAKIEIYQHDATTKMYLLDGAEPTNFFALAYDEDNEPCWYYPVEAISNTKYIPVLDEHCSWSWNLISGAVLQHILGHYRTVRLCDDGCLAYIHTPKSSRRRYQR